MERDERESTTTIRQASFCVLSWFVRVLPDALRADDCASILGFCGKTRFAYVPTNADHGMANGYERYHTARYVLDMAMDGIKPDAS